MSQSEELERSWGIGDQCGFREEGGNSINSRKDAEDSVPRFLRATNSGAPVPSAHMLPFYPTSPRCLEPGGECRNSHERPGAGADDGMAW
jgi:hypothetical protein